MKRIKQTDISTVTGNCFHTCVACVLGLELSEMPSFSPQNPGGEENGTWFTPWKQWFLDNNIGWFEYIFECWPEQNTKFQLGDGQLCILSGKSPRGDHNHAVVAKYEQSPDLSWGFQLYHDPHPDDTYIEPPFTDIFVLWHKADARAVQGV